MLICTNVPVSQRASPKSTEPWSLNPHQVLFHDQIKKNINSQRWEISAITQCVLSPKSRIDDKLDDKMPRPILNVILNKWKSKPIPPTQSRNVLPLLLTDTLVTQRFIYTFNFKCLKKLNAKKKQKLQEKHMKITCVWKLDMKFWEYYGKSAGQVVWRICCTNK